MYSAGMFDDRLQALSLLDFPDIQAEIALETAGLEAAKIQIDQMLEENNYIPPDKYMELAPLLKVATKYYSLAIVRSYPDSAKAIIRKVIDKTKDLLVAAAKEQLELQQRVQGPPAQQAQAQAQQAQPAVPALQGQPAQQAPVNQ